MRGVSFSNTYGRPRLCNVLYHHGAQKSQMTLKIERAVEGRFVVFSLSGRIEVEHLAELQRLFEIEAQDLTVVLDMKEVKLVDRNAVTFLARCQADGAKLENCPAYVREWIEREAGRK